MDLSELVHNHRSNGGSGSFNGGGGGGDGGGGGSSSGGGDQRAAAWAAPYGERHLLQQQQQQLQHQREAETRPGDNDAAFEFGGGAMDATMTTPTQFRPPPSTMMMGNVGAPGRQQQQQRHHHQLHRSQPRLVAVNSASPSSSPAEGGAAAAAEMRPSSAATDHAGFPMQLEVSPGHGGGYLPSVSGFSRPFRSKLPAHSLAQSSAPEFARPAQPHDRGYPSDRAPENDISRQQASAASAPPLSPQMQFQSTPAQAMIGGGVADTSSSIGPRVLNLLTCDICERTFDQQSMFDSHMAVFHRRSATPTKPRSASFSCPHCGKGFTSPSKVNVHVEATHLGMRPFQCDLCNKCFGYKGDLTKHKATHSGLKEHTCYICGAKFGRNFYVKRHILTVHEKQESPAP